MSKEHPEEKAARITTKGVIMGALIGMLGTIITAVLAFPPFQEFMGYRRNPPLGSNEACPAYLESNGQVVMNADQYIQQVPGRAYLPDKTDAIRDAVGISWQKYADFPHTMQALPNSQMTNTEDHTNGPALVYLIDFHTVGKYYVYIRGFGPNDNSDSIHVGLGGLPVTTDFGNGFSVVHDISSPRWVGMSDMGDPVVVEVQNPGLNTFYVWMRENGVNVQRIWLDTGANKVPNGDSTEGPAISSCADLISD